MKVLTYNIHKGVSSGLLKPILNRIKASIRSSGADLVLLQEIVGDHVDPTKGDQLEFLADEVWPHFAYGKNAVYSSGHHGNAILSKHPILESENIDISRNRFEKRGMLHARIAVLGIAEPVHVICLHLGLFENDRMSQLEALSARIRESVPENAPLLVGGDFNDWRSSADSILVDQLGLQEAFVEKTGRHAKTFPSWFPILSLDRMYYRGWQCVSSIIPSGNLWSGLSDHAALLGEFTVPDQG